MYMLHSIISGFLMTHIRRVYMDFDNEAPAPDDPFHLISPGLLHNPFEDNIDEQLEGLDPTDANELHHGYNDFIAESGAVVGPGHGLDYMVKGQQAREITYVYTAIWTLRADDEERYKLN